MREIAARFLVDVSTIVRLLKRYRQTGSVDPRPHAGGRRPVLGGDDLKRLWGLVREQPDATLDELRDRLGVDCGRTTVARALKRLRITRKKTVLHDAQRDTPEGRERRTAFLEAAAGVDPRRLVFVDETGANTSMTRAYGRAPEGGRVEAAAPRSWTTLTLICDLRFRGATAPFVFRGATDAAAFETYAEKVLAPRLHRGDVVIWDNVSPHKAAAVLKAVHRAGAEVIPLPTSSPDFSPIEEMFSKLKGELRSAAARSTDAVIDAIGDALRKHHHTARHRRLVQFPHNVRDAIGRRSSSRRQRISNHRRLNGPEFCCQQKYCLDRHLRARLGEFHCHPLIPSGGLSP
ncbi:IS630 family transposase [Paludisphaera rhizosphaerae]|uniref:IS630 family transposase n=1 Tax=Paludisphaera rhizosphaerae TaxID=2711216 RepID=UPI0013ECE9C2|nr:IS630 family transposase [Paludisphaera rhizosphaerae]